MSKKVVSEFHDKVIVLTGASSGIGRCLALRAAAAGARLVLAARNAERLETVADECRKIGTKVVVVPTDVEVEADCRALIERAAAEFGRLDVLVNNAGFGVVSRFEDYADLGLFRKVIDVNFNGAVSCTYHALKHLKASRGRIVNVSSVGGRLAIPWSSSYIASKFALEGFSESLRMELAKDGVGVTVICPYWVVTGFHENVLDRQGARKGPDGRSFYTKEMMSADRCAELILETAARRRRELVMSPGRIGLFLKALTPGLLDRIALKAFLKTVAERRNSQ